MLLLAGLPADATWNLEDQHQPMRPAISAGKNWVQFHKKGPLAPTP